MELMTISFTTIAEKVKTFAIGSIFGFIVFTFFTTSNIPRVNQIFIPRTISSTKDGLTASTSTTVLEQHNTTLQPVLVPSKTPTPWNSLESKTPPVSSSPPPSVTGASNDQSESYTDRRATKGDGAEMQNKSPCNIFDGKWIYKPSESPAYKADQCPFISVGINCQKNGRPDSEYQGWIWQPYGCDIPQFNGSDILERLRGKKIIMVGDSLNHNQWLSLACLIYTSIAPSRRHLVKIKGGKLFKVKDYDFSLMFRFTPFLVHNDSKHPSGLRVLCLDKIDPSSKIWREADVLVFNSAHWWDHPTPQWDVLEFKGQLIKDMPKELGYEHALTTWSNWLVKNINPFNTTVFFRSNSPSHYNNLWCRNSIRPIPDDLFLRNYPRSMVDVAERAILCLGHLKFPIKYLNITWLSGYRRDAHPSVYFQEESKQVSMLKEAQSSKIETKQKSDCSHWCVPGLPDTWNRLLYASLFFI